MALGDRINCPLGGVVETTFQLDFKKARVAELPDGADFKFVNFEMLSRAQNKVDAGLRIKPESVEVTQDDQRISVRWQFNNLPAQGQPDFVKVGDEWELRMSYMPTNSGQSSASERLFTLGTVKITGP